MADLLGGRTQGRISAAKGKNLATKRATFWRSRGWDMEPVDDFGPRLWDLMYCLARTEHSC